MKTNMDLSHYPEKDLIKVRKHFIAWMVESIEWCFEQEGMVMPEGSSLPELLSEAKAYLNNKVKYNK